MHPKKVRFVLFLWIWLITLISNNARSTIYVLLDLEEIQLLRILTKIHFPVAKPHHSICPMSTFTGVSNQNHGRIRSLKFGSLQHQDVVLTDYNIANQKALKPFVKLFRLSDFNKISQYANTWCSQHLLIMI